MNKTRFLINAIEAGDVLDVERLLQEGAKPNGYKFSPLEKAINTGNKDIVEALFKAGADVNAIHPVEGELFKEAIKRGTNDIVSLFIQHGADINLGNDFGWTPFMYAVLEGKIDAVMLMLRHDPDFVKETKRGETALMIAEEKVLEAMENLARGYVTDITNWESVLDVVKAGHEKQLLDSTISSQRIESNHLNF